RIRRIATNGIIDAVAGTGASASTGDGGPAVRASILDARGIAVGTDGSLYVAETGAQRIRQVTPDGVIRTIAGNGLVGFSGDGGPATDATFKNPYAVAVGPDDSVYVIDQGNLRVRWLRAGGIVNTLAGGGVNGAAGDGGPALQASLQNLETGLA